MFEHKYFNKINKQMHKKKKNRNNINNFNLPVCLNKLLSVPENVILDNSIFISSLLPPANRKCNTANLNCVTQCNALSKYPRGYDSISQLSLFAIC